MEAEGNQSTQRCKRLLVVEDREDIRKLIERMLALRNDYRCELLATAHEALDRFVADPNGFDAALLDFELDTDGPTGKGNGAALCAAMRMTRPELPVVFVSGWRREDLGKVLDEPHTSYLAKPFTPDRLFQVVDDVLRN